MTKIRFIRLDSLWETVYWTIRSWWTGYWIPRDRKSWTSTQDSVIPLDEEIGMTFARFAFLAPHFAARGYYLFAPKEDRAPVPPQGSKAYKHESPNSYPYARGYFENDREAEFMNFLGMKVWAARDALGRELVIKLVSGFSDEDETEEFRVLKLLNAPSKREDPRNRSVPILDYVTYDGLVFAVMPRWGGAFVVLDRDFTTIEQIVQLADQLFEGLAFLHENKIAHRDIAGSNVVLNHLVPEEGSETLTADDLRDPRYARYAFIDFEIAALFSMDTEIDSVVMQREVRIEAGRAGLKEGVSNPFKDDVFILGHYLQRFVRVIESVVPDVGPFFDNILRDRESPPTASACLEEWRKVTSALTEEQLQHKPPGFTYERNGTVTPYYADM